MSDSTSNKALHVGLILLVFTITGFTVGKFGVWITAQMGIERFSVAYFVIWIVGLLPVYNVILILVASIFGKYSFFRAKQLKTWKKLKGLFGFK